MCCLHLNEVKVSTYKTSKPSSEMPHLFNVQTPAYVGDVLSACLCAWRPVAGVDDRLCHLETCDVVHVEELQHVLRVWVNLNDVHLNGRLLQANDTRKL